MSAGSAGAWGEAAVGAADRLVYLDANATTSVSPTAKRVMCQWVNSGNPSAEYRAATDCKFLLAEFRALVAKHTHVENACTSDGPDAFRIVITSGGTESICTLIRSVVDAWTGAGRPAQPWIVCSAIEHKATTACVAHLESIGAARARWVQPGTSGFVAPAAVRAAIVPGQTALIVVMAANNETGAINDTASIGDIARTAKVPYFCDAVQMFGKMPFVGGHVSAFALSMHKVHGPKGVGVLAIRRSFAERAQLKAVLHGSQNSGFRGGTENVPGIAASIIGIGETFAAPRARAFFEARAALIVRLNESVSVRPYTDYVDTRDAAGLVSVLEIVVVTPGVVGPAGRPVGLDHGGALLSLPNTLQLAVVGRGKPVCNTFMRKALLERGFIVSVGSACNTASPDASHVLKAMRADPLLLKGVLRVSMEHPDTKNCRMFADALLRVISEYG